MTRAIEAAVEAARKECRELGWNDDYAGDPPDFAEIAIRVFVESVAREGVTGVLVSPRVRIEREPHDIGVLVKRTTSGRWIKVALLRERAGITVEEA